MSKWQQLANVVRHGGAIRDVFQGVGQAFRMLLIVFLFVVLIVTAMVSCSRSNKIADLRVENQRLKDRVEHLESLPTVQFQPEGAERNAKPK